MYHILTFQYLLSATSHHCDSLNHSGEPNVNIAHRYYETNQEQVELCDKVIFKIRKETFEQQNSSSK